MQTFMKNINSYPVIFRAWNQADTDETKGDRLNRESGLFGPAGNSAAFGMMVERIPGPFGKDEAFEKIAAERRKKLQAAAMHKYNV